MIKKTFFIFSTLFFSTLTLHAQFYYSGGKKHTLTTLKTDRAVGNSSLSFKMQNGVKVEINTKLITSFSDKSVKKDIEKKYDLKLIKALTDSMFLYSIKDAHDTVEVSNKIYEESGVEFCHPDFKKKKTNRAITHDPYAWDAWHLKDEDYNSHSDINILKAWRYNKGEGVKVAVYDTGIDIDHPDLRENVYAFKNYNDANSDIPYAPKDALWHGTACAGILCASENNIGSVGVAPKASLYAVGYSENDISKDIEAYKWLMDEGVSVINNSWGSYSALDAYTAIFKELATKGRDGKGIIIIFAAGNEGKDLDLSTINDESESPYVISVAASTRQNTIASYSNYGSSIDFAAPGGSGNSGLFTTDARGEAGFNNSDYNQKFIGTSAAAPIVAGAVTLMLSENPKLTRQDVYNILKYTADKNGNYTYDENGFNTHWGYGKIDAGSAVEVAHSYGNSNLKNFARTMFIEMIN